MLQEVYTITCSSHYQGSPGTAITDLHHLPAPVPSLRWYLTPSPAFIAATIMLNWFRWTADLLIAFVAPTNPLASQQVKACFNVARIPRSATTMLPCALPPHEIRKVLEISERVLTPGLRAEEWQSKRVFFMTPQTIINDLKTGICDPKGVVNSWDRRNKGFRDDCSQLCARSLLLSACRGFSSSMRPTVRQGVTLTLKASGWTWVAAGAGRKANMGVKGVVVANFYLLAGLSHGIGPFYHRVDNL